MAVFKQSSVPVDLDSDLRGKVEQFDVVKFSPLKQNQLGESKERQKLAQKYSHFVSEINRKATSRSPPMRSPVTRFDAQAYKKQF